MSEDGYFWAMERGEIPPSPVRLLLGWQLLEARPAMGTVRAQFQVKSEFFNPAGVVQGGILAAMLDNVLGAALAARLEADRFVVTLELKTSFIRPVKEGVLIGEGRVVNQGKTIAFLEGHLEDDAGNLLATASATACVAGANNV